MSEPKEFYEDDMRRAYEEGMAAGAREQWEKAQEDAREREATQEEWSNPVSEPEGPFVAEPASGTASALAACIALLITRDAEDKIQSHVTLACIDSIVCDVLNGKPIPEL